MSTLPVRCFTCGKIIAKQEFITKFLEGKSSGKQRETLDEMKFRRRCCRRHMLGYADDLDEMQKYYGGARGERAFPELPKVKGS